VVRLFIGAGTLGFLRAGVSGWAMIVPDYIVLFIASYLELILRLFLKMRGSPSYLASIWILIAYLCRNL
jgi:hypothetical protein